LTKSTRRVRAITFEYDGIARREVEAAKSVAARAGVVEHKFVRLPDLKEAGDIPGFELGRLPPTYIPLRNSIFYSFAASYAEVSGATSIVGGHNRDDEKVFDDVSPEFFSSLERALWTGSPVLRKNRVRIVRPLGRKRKAEVVKLAASLGVPLELTWSCHREGLEHCWRCDGCLSRRGAFLRAGIPDPISDPQW
jgi:7-cyano-7-deazaguanine synthase